MNKEDARAELSKLENKRGYLINDFKRQNEDEIWGSTFPDAGLLDKAIASLTNEIDKKIAEYKNILGS